MVVIWLYGDVGCWLLVVGVILVICVCGVSGCCVVVTVGVGIGMYSVVMDVDLYMSDGDTAFVGCGVTSCVCVSM